MARHLGFASFLSVFLCAPPLAMAAGKVTVVHGVPGITVDVYVNGALTLEGFTPRSIAGPLELDAGDYAVAVAPAGAGIEAAVITASATLEDGAFVSLVAHLAEDGTPVLSPFALDASPSAAGSRLTVAHTAAAPAVDVGLRRFSRSLGKVEGLSNGESASLDLSPGIYGAVLYPTGSEEKVFGPAYFFLKRGYLQVVYAIGSLEGGTFELLRQKIPFERPAPVTGLVSVVHGIPGLTVDVFVDGALTLDDFAPGTVTDPLELPAGEYAVAITGSEGGDPSDPILSATVTLEAGQNATLVAHLDADGNPVISPFLNDLSALEPYKGRVVVRHTAAAPAVDVTLKRGQRTAAKIEDLSNGEEAQADAYAGTYRAAVFPAGAKRPVLGPANLLVKARTVNIVYAVGSLEDGSLGLIVQRLPTHDTSRPSWPSFLFWWIRG